MFIDVFTLRNENDMKTITSQEEALKLFEENSIKQAQTLETGNFKLGNECFDNKIKCLSYLYKTNGMGMLEQLLSHENVGVRESASYAYLSVCPQKGEEVLSEIANGNYGIHSFNAEMILKEWKKRELKFIFMDE
jgi:hypothetical protein